MVLSFRMQTALFQAVPFPPVVLWLVVSTLLVGIIISVRRRRSSRAQSPRAKTECCNGTSAKKIQTDSYHSVELLGTSADLRLTISKETIDVQCDCHCCNTDFQDLVKVTCADRPLEIVPLGMRCYKELLCTLIFMLLYEVVFHVFWREDVLVGIAAIKFVQFMTIVLGVLFAHVSLVQTEDGLTHLELGLRVIIQNKLVCLMSYVALESILLYGRVAEVIVEVSEDTLCGIVVIYVCIYSSTIGVIQNICLQPLFKFTIATQIPIIVILTNLIISALLNTFFLIMACLWLMLSVTLFVAEIISAFRHIDHLHHLHKPVVQKESLDGIIIKV
ncbi:uncharacterized protein LOC144860609 isoform X2 [Branchiostoma floridae x Branchiostoma japonicum]